MIAVMTLEDALAVARNLREWDRLDMESLHGTFNAERFAIGRFQAPGVAFTAHGPDGKPALIGGIEVPREGLGNLWMAGTPDYNKVMLTATRYATREAIPNAWRAGLRRLQAMVRVDENSGEAPSALAYASRIIGMYCEGTARCLGVDGADFVTFSLIDPEVL